MPWNSVSPAGLLSVKANKIPMQQNNAYIQTTMGNSVVGTNTAATRDHFWNVGANEDGRHRFVQSPRFTSTAGLLAPDDVNPLLGTGMDGVTYLRLVNADVGTIQGFYRSIGVGGGTSIYQYIPTYVIADIASLNIILGYNFVATVPKNVYGYIEWYIIDNATGKYKHGSKNSGFGYFISNETVVDAWAYMYLVQGSSGADSGLKFGNGSEASGLDIVVRSNGVASAAHIRFKITYRAIDQDG